MPDIEVIFAGEKTLGIIANADLLVVAEKRDDVWEPSYVLALDRGELLTVDQVPAVYALVVAAGPILDKSVALKVRVSESITDLGLRS